MPPQWNWLNTSAFHAEDQGFDPPRWYQGSLAELSHINKTVIIAATSGAAEPETSTVQGVLLEKEIAVTRGTGPVCSDSAVRCERVRN